MCPRPYASSPSHGLLFSLFLFLHLSPCSRIDIPGLLAFPSFTASGPLSMRLIVAGLLALVTLVQAQGCGIANPCAVGCCSKYGFCGLGPDCKGHCAARIAAAELS